VVDKIRIKCQWLYVLEVHLHNTHLFNLAVRPKKSKMTSFELKVPISQLGYKIGTTCQWLCLNYFSESMEVWGCIYTDNIPISPLSRDMYSRFERYYLEFQTSG